MKNWKSDFLDFLGRKADFSDKKRTDLRAFYQKGPLSDQGLIKRTYLAELLVVSFFLYFFHINFFVILSHVWSCHNLCWVLLQFKFLSFSHYWWCRSQAFSRQSLAIFWLFLLANSGYSQAIFRLFMANSD